MLTPEVAITKKVQLDIILKGGGGRSGGEMKDKRPSADRGKKNLIVISNRLPITINYNKEEEKFSYNLSSGGLVSALNGLLKEYSFIWIGWPGIAFDSKDEESKESKQNLLKNELLKMYGCVPVFLDENLVDKYCNIFSNRLLWPLFHYISSNIQFNDTYWNAYQEANECFADQILTYIESLDKNSLENDEWIFWVHDYHIMLTPYYLRKKLNNLDKLKNFKIGFFLHTPFPSSELFKILPVGKEILNALLQCDLVGFHTYDYLRHFQACCTTILGLSTMPDHLYYQNRKVKTGVFPIGIEPEKFANGVKSEGILAQIEIIRKQHLGKFIILGVERLDYIKGVPNKLIAFEKFFQKYPQFLKKVVLIQIGVPSRVDVLEYKNLKMTVDQLVGQINGKYGTLDYVPVHWLNKSVNFEELTALYSMSDVCVIASIRDGMNLVAYEYIATKLSNPGALIVSEFAGAAHSLNGSIIVNQWNTDDLADAYYEALTISDDIKKANFSKLISYVTKHTSVFWGISFINEINRETFEFSEKLNFDKSTEENQTITCEQIVKISNSETLLIIDGDVFINGTGGTIAKLENFIQSLHNQGVQHENLILLLDQDQDQINLEYTKKLEKICSFVISDDLLQQTSNKQLTNSNNTLSSTSLNETNWKVLIKNLLGWYQERTIEGIEIIEEEKNATIIWALKEDEKHSPLQSDDQQFSSSKLLKEFNRKLSKELLMNLERLVSYLPVKIFRNNNFADSPIKVTLLQSDRFSQIKSKLMKNSYKKIIYISDSNDIVHWNLKKTIYGKSNYLNFEQEESPQLITCSIIPTIHKGYNHHLVSNASFELSIN